MKFIFNSQIVKIFCEIKKNNAKIKKKEKKNQSIIEQLFYLKINDRKSRLNYTKAKIFEAFVSHNQITNR